MKRYTIKEMFYSLQGEGVRAGTANVFVRFAGCNLDCNEAVHGFDCDTDFKHGEKMTGEQIYEAAEMIGRDCGNVIFTGGEPALQLDADLLDIFVGYHCAIETNGTKPLPPGLDWITVSPKPPDDMLAVSKCNEVKYVLADGQRVPATPPIEADHWVVSPAFEQGIFKGRSLSWCLAVVRDNPRWRLSMQQHKLWSVR
jgi:organic radical activating enzyme